MIERVKELVSSIIDNKKGFGMSAFVVLKPNGNEDTIIKKFMLDDDLLCSVKKMFVGVLQEKFLDENILIESFEDISDERCVFYEIPQTTSFRPFKFEEQYKLKLESYDESLVDDIVGFAFRFSINNKKFWMYQHICYSQLVKRSKNIYAILSKDDVYRSLDRDIIKIESKFDVLIVDNTIITSKIKLLERCFGFDVFIREEAQDTIDFICSMDIVNDIEMIGKFENKKSLTNAKKLLKVKKSPVLRMNRDTLIKRVKVHPRYSDVVIEDDKISLKTQKDVLEFINLLNDNFLKSELTEAEYDSTVKKELEPIT